MSIFSGVNNPGLDIATGSAQFTTQEVTQLLALIGTPSLGFLAATGTVNGTNTSFTFTQEPSYIVSDGAWYRLNHGWTWSNPTATLIAPPTFDIWAFA